MRLQKYEYSTALLFCDLPHWMSANFWNTTSDAAPAPAPAPSPSHGSTTSDSATGAQRPWVVVGLGRRTFRPLVPLHLPSAPTPELPDLVFCAISALPPGEGARGIPEWLDYHLFHLGLDHLVLYDAGGAGLGGEEEGAGAGAPLVRRFVDAGKLTVVDFRDQALFPAEGNAQVGACRPCQAGVCRWHTSLRTVVDFRGQRLCPAEEDRQLGTGAPGWRRGCRWRTAW